MSRRCVPSRVGYHSYHSGHNHYRKFILARDGWAPAVSYLRDSDLGGRNSYVDMVEQVEVHVYRASPKEVLDNLTLMNTGQPPAKVTTVPRKETNSTTNAVQRSTAERWDAPTF